MKQKLKQLLGPKLFARFKRWADVVVTYRKATYSQFGEDQFLAEYFKDQAQGQFVDVGAFHPRQFSNTYLLYQRGWTGVNIDATPGSMALFHVLRPKDHNVESAISADGRKITFASWGTNSENTAQSGQIQGVAQNKGQPMAMIEMQSKTLTQILSGFRSLRPDFELLSVDVEGMDLEVLQSLDWTRYRPKLIIAEQFGRSIDEVMKSDVYRYLTERRYRLLAWYHPSLFFERIE